MRQFKSQAEAEAAGVYVSKVKSYVKREGRLTKGQEKALADYWPTMGIDRLNLVTYLAAPRL